MVCCVNFLFIVNVMMLLIDELYSIIVILKNLVLSVRLFNRLVRNIWMVGCYVVVCLFWYDVMLEDFMMIIRLMYLE